MMFVQLLVAMLVVASTVAFRGVPLVAKRFAPFAAVSTSTSGEAGTDTFRVNFADGGKAISPWHDIPLKDGEFFNFVNEIPKYTKAKMEVSTKESTNPIAQDIKKGKLRDYHGPIFWNYGCLPQTWEDPNVEHPVVKCFGDNDPVDVVEIGSKSLETGSVSKVKVLGVLAMIDDGELDWKVIAINSEDALASELNDIADVEAKCPGTVSGIREWFRWYKTPDDKPLNAFGFDEECLPRAKALEVIEETHEFWKNLKEGKTDKGKLWLN
ncbi:putative inorganic pyrophosphatase [Ochromonadaceae sp. CCMP2298]|nr:putative inorganic pyrophosphatase [Ochromonadaceae sp. CCMP2298]